MMGHPEKGGKGVAFIAFRISRIKVREVARATVEDSFRGSLSRCCIMHACQPPWKRAIQKAITPLPPLDVVAPIQIQLP